jgi:hypothetical protein
MNRALFTLLSIVVTLVGLTAILAFDAPPELMLSAAAAAPLPASIQSALEGIKDMAEGKVGDISDRLATLEQVVASGGHASGIQSGWSESLGSEAARKLADDPNFQSAADAVGRGVRAGNFSARVNLDSSIKAAITTIGIGQVGDTSTPSDRERGPTVMPVQRPLRLLQALPSRRVGSSEIEYVRLSMTGDAGEQLLEGDLKAEVDAAGELVTANIATVAAHTTASRQILDDSSGLANAIDNLLRYKVLAKLESLLVNGAGGTASRIEGLLTLATTFTPTVGTTPADIVGEAINDMAIEGYSPNLVLMNPADWFALQITKRGTSDEAYVFGSPTAPIPPALWNVPVVATPAIPAGTSMAIDTNFTTVLDRMQASVMIATEHSDNFVRNLVTLLGEVRAGLEVTDTAAVTKFSLVSAP